MPRAKRTKNQGLRGFVKTLVLDDRTGKVVGYREVDNIVLDQGLDYILKGIGDISPVHFFNRSAHVGSSTANATVPSLTNLVGPLGGGVRKTVGTSTSSPGTVQYTWSYATSEFTNTSVGSVFGEVGMFRSTDTTLNDIICRATFPQTTKTSDMVINFTYQLFFSA